MEESKETTDGYEVYEPSSSSSKRLKIAGYGEEYPTELDTSRHPYFVSVAKDKRTARYVGRRNHGGDVGAVRAARPAPARVALYYFEVRVVSAGAAGAITVGLGDRRAALTRQPGLEAGTYGYKGDTGKIMSFSIRSKEYGPTFTTGDTVGCGIDFENQEIFFTLNGKHLGKAFEDVTKTLYPTVGLHSPGEVVEFNFGQDEFSFDLDEFNKARAAAARAARARRPPAPLVLRALVRDHLLAAGYRKTLEAFEKATGQHQQESVRGRHVSEEEAAMAYDELRGTTNGAADMQKKNGNKTDMHEIMEGKEESNSTMEMEVDEDSSARNDEKQENEKDDEETFTDFDLERRRLQSDVDIQDLLHTKGREKILLETLFLRTSMRDYILQGNVEAAKEAAVDACGSGAVGLWTKRPAGRRAAAALAGWAFAGLAGRGDPLAAIAFAREHISPFLEDKNVEEEVKVNLRRLPALLAFARPARSPLAALVSPAQGRRVAAAANAAVLDYLTSSILCPLLSTNHSETRKQHVHHQTKSVIQYLLATLTLMKKIQREVAGNKGVPFDLMAFPDDTPAIASQYIVAGTETSSPPSSLSGVDDDFCNPVPPPPPPAGSN